MNENENAGSSFFCYLDRSDKQRKQWFPFDYSSGIPGDQGSMMMKDFDTLQLCCRVGASLVYQIEDYYSCVYLSGAMRCGSSMQTRVRPPLARLINGFEY